jgi:hypothetical protein
MRRPKLIVMILMLGALLWPSRAESPVQALVQDDPADARPADVQIEHQLIRVAEPLPLPRRTASPVVNRLSSVRKPEQTRQDGFVVRARRLIVGNGRYRPEPFPRPGR